MSDSRWYTSDAMPALGTELFHSRRKIRVWEQTVSHGQLLLRAVDTDHPTRVDLLFKPVEAMRLRASYDGLVVRCATEDEVAAFRQEMPGVDIGGSGRVFLLESGQARDFVVAGAFGWHEDDAVGSGPSALSPAVYPYAAPWSSTALAFGARELSGNAAALGELVGALVAGAHRIPTPDRYRYVHVVMARIRVSLANSEEKSEVQPVGAYLTRAEAEEAIRVEADANADVVARAAEPGADLQTRIMALSARAGVEKWIEAVPVQL